MFWFRRKEKDEVVERVALSDFASLHDIIRELLEEVRKRNKPLVTDFNGVDILARPGLTFDEVLLKYRQDREARTLQQMQALKPVTKASPIPGLIIEFNELDLTNRELLLEWLSRFGQAWQFGEVVDGPSVARKILGAGLYKAIRHTDGREPTNRQEHADLLISQAISWLEGGSGFPEIFPILVDQWRVRVW